MYRLFLDDKMYLTDDRVGEEIERLSSEVTELRSIINYSLACAGRSPAREIERRLKLVLGKQT